MRLEYRGTRRVATNNKTADGKRVVGFEALRDFHMEAGGFHTMRRNPSADCPRLRASWRARRLKQASGTRSQCFVCSNRNIFPSLPRRRARWPMDRQPLVDSTMGHIIVDTISIKHPAQTATLVVAVAAKLHVGGFYAGS